jgi:alkanesulfonate monooxygenase SsuD/methylene tetrahydromethanopterin reductase-like flavin-dependent oxidoreductase (luciferase family)
MNYMPAREAAERNRIVDRAARAAGRDPAEIRRIYLIPGALARSAPAPASDDDQAIVGPPEHWAEVLTHFATDLGVGTFVLAAPPDPQTLTSFIEDVAPRVRERVAEHRDSSPSPAPTTRTGAVR